MDVRIEQLQGTVVASAVDREAILRRAAHHNELPTVKTVDAARLVPSVSASALPELMRHFHLDVHHAAAVLRTCPNLETADPASPRIAFLSEAARHLRACGLLADSPYRPDPAELTLLNDAPTPENPLYVDVPRLLLDGPRRDRLEIVEADDPEAQVDAVVAEIVRLVGAGVARDDILVVNATAADVRRLARIARTFGIRLVAADGVPLMRLPFVRAFLEACEREPAETVWRRLLAEDGSADEEDRRVLDALARLREAYDGVFPDALVLAFECRRTILPPPPMAGVVRCHGGTDFSALDDRHILVMNMTDDRFPEVAADDDYLSDVEKLAVGREPSTILNARRRQVLARRVATVPRLLGFRPLNVDGIATLPAAVATAACATVARDFRPDTMPLSASDGIRRYARLRRERTTAGIVAPGYGRLAAAFSRGFATYEPAFPRLPETVAGRLRADTVAISATALETFAKCRFRYLCDHLLRLAPQPPSLAQELGRIAHRGLSEAFAHDVPAATAARAAATDAGPRLAALADILAARLAIVETRLRSRSAQLTEWGHEIELVRPYRQAGFLIKGTIDRVTVRSRGDRTFVFVFDYKTGSPDFSPAGFADGTDIQAVFYLHLLRLAGSIPGFVPAGFYYQPVTIGRLPHDPRRDAVGEALKAVGLTLADPSAVAAVGGPEALRNVRLKEDGTFYANAAVVSDSAMEAMLAAIDRRIGETVEAILAGDFAIDPAVRAPGKPSTSCEYCRNASVCHFVDFIPEAAEVDPAAETEED